MLDCLTRLCVVTTQKIIVLKEKKFRRVELFITGKTIQFLTLNLKKSGICIQQQDVGAFLSTIIINVAQNFLALRLHLTGFFYPKAFSEDNYHISLRADCCQNCLVDFKSESARFVCTRCRSTLYCCKTCQRKDWKEHKVECVKK